MAGLVRLLVVEVDPRQLQSSLAVIGAMEEVSEHTLLHIAFVCNVILKKKKSFEYLWLQLLFRSGPALRICVRFLVPSHAAPSLRLFVRTVHRHYASTIPTAASETLFTIREIDEKIPSPADRNGWVGKRLKRDGNCVGISNSTLSNECAPADIGCHDDWENEDDINDDESFLELVHDEIMSADAIAVISKRGDCEELMICRSSRLV